MKKTLILFLAFLVFFVIMTGLFLHVYGDAAGPYGMSEWWLTIACSLPHSLCVTSWLMLLPSAAMLVFCWVRGAWLRNFMRWYVPLACMPVLFLYVLDLVLYGFWGFRLDTTPLVYIMDNPVEAMGESPWWAPVVSIVAMTAMFFGVRWGTGMLFPARRSGSVTRMLSGGELKRESGLLAMWFVVLCCVAGGLFGTISMGSAYHSDLPPLNHAATNPVYSFCHSWRQQKLPLSDHYRLMPEDEASALVSKLGYGEADAYMPADTLLRTSRPNILLVLLESFSGAASSYLHPEIADADVMPCLNAAMSEGVAFTQFYANSFRTERGIASVLAACPGQPIHTILIDTVRAAGLPQIARTLVEEGGYEARFFTGGDSHFCGLLPFLRHGDYSEVVGRDDFAVGMHDGPWGLQDKTAYVALYEQLENSVLRQNADTTGSVPPFFEVCMSVSSHEPFEVPFSRFEDPYLNSVAYADQCLGELIDALRNSPVWDNLLIIALADHGYAQYPAGVQQHDPLRYHIPMVWLGGALRPAPDNTVGSFMAAVDAGPCHRDVNTLSQQTDLAATLLHQLGLPAQDFPFSHDIFAADAPHFAFYAWPDGFGMLTENGCWAQDNNRPGYPLKASMLDGYSEKDAENLGKAYLQTLYDYLSKL